MLRLVSWNLARRPEAWRALANADADLALVQEACEPPDDIAARVGVDPAPWITEGARLARPWRTAVVRLNPELDVEWELARSIHAVGPRELAVSRLGTLAIAHVRLRDQVEPLTLVSMYACWERPHASTGSGWIYADASAHRLISDLSVFIGRQGGHRLLAAGDLNILHGHGEDGSPYWAARYRTIFERMAALGIPFVGPQAPNGCQADPWPDELPPESGNVPTYHTTHQTPQTATRQLDFVFASAELAPRVTVRALNTPEVWGPSDHCRVAIAVEV